MILLIITLVILIISLMIIIIITVIVKIAKTISGHIGNTINVGIIHPVIAQKNNQEIF